MSINFRQTSTQSHVNLLSQFVQVLASQAVPTGRYLYIDVLYDSYSMSLNSDVSKAVRTLAVALDEGVRSCRAFSLRSAEAVVIPACTKKGSQSSTAECIDISNRAG